MGDKISYLIFAPPEDERRHHFLRSRNALLGKQRYFRVALGLEHSPQRVEVIRELVGQDEVHQRLQHVTQITNGAST